MEIAVDLRIVCDDQWAKRFVRMAGSSFRVKSGSSKVGAILVESTRPIEKKSIEGAVQWLLSELAPYVAEFRQVQTTLRIGVFFNPESVAALSLELSSGTLSSMVECNMSIDATFFPCSEDDG